MFCLQAESAGSKPVYRVSGEREKLKISLKSNHGIAIGILVAVILLLVLLFMLVYLLLTLLSLPERQLPREAEGYAEYLYEAVESAAKFAEPEAPEGMRYRSVPLMVSTNLVQWDYVLCRVDSKGVIHAPDSSALVLHGTWSESLGQWTEFFPVLIRAGTNATAFFRLP